jgi:hypothetical protein
MPDEEAVFADSLILETCRELDGCCLTHSPCFLVTGAVAEQACQGWPCPRDQRASAEA